MQLNIRPAKHSDAEAIMRLLRQVNDVHADGRPDLFIHGKTKYNSEELEGIIDNPQTPIFVGETESGEIAGYCFCMVQDHTGSNNLRGIKTLYIDDLCIDERMRGQHIGHQIYDYVKSYAREQGFYNLTLNVWSCNPGAMRFYESLGLKPQKIGMEAVLFPEGAEHA
ncbi:MAG: GNAT family N-acetyltransferase [Muribaculaceae bacterium]|nr:GNAT family N-acetyltransferase [Muribaculaceae bacterium]